MARLWIMIFLGLVHVTLAKDLNAALQKFLNAASGRSSFADNSRDVRKLYDLYTVKFHRFGRIGGNERDHFRAFNDTLNAMLNHHRSGSKTFTLELNELSDKTPNELKNLRGAQLPNEPMKKTNAKTGQHFLAWNGRRTKAKILPDSFDWTTSIAAGTSISYVLPIRSQGQCGSCYAFAFVTLLEFLNAARFGGTQPLSEQQIVDCSTKTFGCNGGWFTTTFDYLQGNSWQMDSGTQYPYVEKAQTCAFQAPGTEGVQYPTLLYNWLSDNDAAAIQQALVTYGPLWAAIYVGDDTSTAENAEILRTVSSYKSGVLDLNCGDSQVNHAVVIVGYGVDPDTNVPYWKVRNSWGNGWGEDGYFRIRRGANMCKLETYPFYISIPA